MNIRLYTHLQERPVFWRATRSTILLTVDTNNVVKAPHGHKRSIWVIYDDKNNEEVIKGKGLMGAIFWASVVNVSKVNIPRLMPLRSI